MGGGDCYERLEKGEHRETYHPEEPLLLGLTGSCSNMKIPGNHCCMKGPPINQAQSSRFLCLWTSALRLSLQIPFLLMYFSQITFGLFFSSSKHTESLPYMQMCCCGGGLVALKKKENWKVLRSGLFPFLCGFLCLSPYRYYKMLWTGSQTESFSSALSIWKRN